MIELLSKVDLLQDLMFTWYTSLTKDRNTVKLIQLFMCRNLYLQHDFIAALKNLIKINKSCMGITCIWTQLLLHSGHPSFSSIFIITKLFKMKTKQDSTGRSHRLYNFRLNRRSSLIIGILHQCCQVRNLNTEHNKTIHKQLNNQVHYGGYKPPVFKFDLL